LDLVITAPRELKATGGTGKVLVYDLNRQGERILVPGGEKAALPTMGIIRLFRERERGTAGTKELVRPFTEVERELHWAVLTGVVDHREIQESARQAGFEQFAPQHFYRRIDLQRQTRDEQGNWSAWSMVDPAPTDRVLNNLPEEDEELIEHLEPNLINPLPHRMHGKWEGVNVERLIPRGPVKTWIETPEQPTPGIPGMMRQRQAVPRQLPPELMMRSFDFSVSPGHTYRYRARVVGVDMRDMPRQAAEFFGVWSQPTNAVTVP
jgi:hypothetical protein